MFASYVKRGAYNSLFYAGSSAFVRGINICILPYFLSKLSIIEFGIWDFYQTWFSWFTLLLSSATSTAMIRFYLLYKHDPEKQHQSIANALWLTLYIMIFFLACMSIAIVSGTIGHNSYTSFTIINAAIFALCSMIFAYCRMKE